MTNPTKTWDHATKGRFEGRIIVEDGDWIDISITAKSRVHQARGLVDLRPGDIIQVDKTLLEEVTA